MIDHTSHHFPSFLPSPLCLCLLCPCPLPFYFPLEFRDFDFSSKTLGLLSPWTADLTYARDSKEAEKKKKAIFQNSRASPVSIIIYTSCPLFDTPQISQCFTTLGCFHIPQRFPSHSFRFKTSPFYLFLLSSLALILVLASTLVL
ncbi:hypothetical protein BDV26DRAFT_260698 [Aspergillus bertholletiae]|uniref:Uncharacterized protein n=1 Tax=Aspergillus bertholletiae TaxID=1226010 RepID=A0A5N7BAQ8_9EURO|nr:hypothetical protein BDV26DRAFT_260698 [Aspergillus bertholletiae]